MNDHTHTYECDCTIEVTIRPDEAMDFTFKFCEEHQTDPELKTLILACLGMEGLDADN